MTVGHEPWYRTYFSADFWLLARAEYSEERTRAEVTYILDVLRRYAPGPTVADLACGTGRHAIPLANAGFQVVGIDVSEWAIDEARRQGKELGTTVRWERADLLSATPWPIGTVDVVICIQAFGFGSDADQRRFLRRARDHLHPGGLLILDHSNPFWIAKNFVPMATTQVGERMFELRRSYDVRTGRSLGSMRVSGESDKASLVHDYRLYTTAEVATLIRESGYSLLQIDADFTMDREAETTSRYVQLVCTPAGGPPRGLAVTAYQDSAVAELDLRWAPDEIGWLSISPVEIWNQLMNDPAGAELARTYAVQDPYGAGRAVEILSRHFGHRLREDSVTFAAGITSLLRAAAHLGEGGLLIADQWGHPDLPTWVAAQGGQVTLIADTAGASELLAAIHAGRPSLVVIDRPGLMGSVITREELLTVAHACESIGAVVVVDEAYGNYLGPDNSVISLCDQCENVVILRSLSKGYGWGGLRVGFAVASEWPARRLREFVAPLEVSECAYQMALRLLSAGDVCGPLRARIRAVKPLAVELLRMAGVTAAPGHPDLPWLLVPDADGSGGRRLRDLGIAGKVVVPPPGVKTRGELIRLSLPLSQERLSEFETRIRMAV